MNNKILSIIIRAQDQASKTMEKVGDKTSAISDKIRTSIKVATAVASAAFIAMGASAIKSAGEYEQSRVAFETMLGSADKAKSMLSDISKFARETPFELPEVVQSTKQLLAFGIAQKDLLPTMRRLGDVASGVSVPVGQIAYAYGQVKVAGKLMGTELLQFTNAGVPMIEALADVMKKPQSEIRKLVEQGKVGFPEVEKAFESLTKKGSKFGGMMEKQSHTFNGVVSNIKDSFDQMLRSAVGIDNAGNIVKNGFFEKIKVAAEKVLPVLQDFSQKVGPFMAKSMDVVTTAVNKFASRALDYLMPKLDTLGKVISEKLLPSLRKLWKDVIEPMLPVVGTLFAVAIGVAVDALTIMTDVVGGAIDIFTKLWNGLKEGNPIIWGLVGVFGTLGTAMAMKAGFTALASGFAVVTTRTIPAVMTQFGLMKGLIATPIMMPAIAIGAAIAALAAVIAKHQETQAVIEQTTAAMEKNKRTSDKTDEAMKKAAESGRITQEAYQTYLRNTTRVGREQSKQLQNQYSGVIGNINYWLDSLMGSPAAKKYDELKNASKSGGGGWATGGYTGRGGQYEVAGLVHKGEYVIPKKDVDQTTGLPKLDAMTSNSSFNMYGNILLGDQNAVDRFFDRVDRQKEMGSLGVGV